MTRCVRLIIFFAHLTAPAQPRGRGLAEQVALLIGQGVKGIGAFVEYSQLTTFETRHHPRWCV